MVKLVIQTQSMLGRSHELNVECTTIGRVEDNVFQIADQSVSSHHCEVHLRGAEVLIRDLNSTNGTFINDAQITESVLKPGQKLRLGQIELKLETDAAPSSPAPPPAAPAAKPPAPTTPAAQKRPTESTMIMPRGVSMTDLEGGGGRKPGADGTNMFSKKRNVAGQYFWIAAGIVIVIIIGLIIFVISQAGGNRH
jgi:hypothetical protein